jgi:hypothetical protein
MKFIGSLVLFVFVAGCGSGQHSADKGVLAEAPAKVVVKDGSSEFELKDFTISPPGDWKTFDLTKGDFKQMISEAAKQSPKLAEMAPTLEQAAQSGMIRLFAFDVKRGDDFVDNLNVVVTPGDLAMSIEKLTELNAEQLKSIMRVSPKPTFVDLPGGRAGVIDYPNPSGGPEQKISTIAYIMKQGSDQLTFSFTFKDSRRAGVQKAAEDSMKTVQLKKS